MARAEGIGAGAGEVELVASIRVIRDSAYRDIFRAYAVVLDGKRTCELRRGQTRELSLSPGPHSISARIDCCTKSLEFVATEGETVTFIVRSGCPGWRILLILWYAFFQWDSYLTLTRATTSLGDGLLNLDE